MLKRSNTVYYSLASLESRFLHVGLACLTKFRGIVNEIDSLKATGFLKIIYRECGKITDPSEARTHDPRLCTSSALPAVSSLSMSATHPADVFS